MKGLLVFLRVAVVGFAVLAGGRALYRNRDKLRGSWRSLGGIEGLKVLSGKIPTGRLPGSVGAFKDLAAHFARPK